MKILQKISLIYAVCILLLLGMILMPLINKITNETTYSVALAVEYNDIADFFGKEKFSDFKNAGINTVVITDEKAKDFFSDTEKNKYKKLPKEKYLGVSADKISHLSKLNLDIVFLVMGNISLLPAKTPDVLTVIMSDDSYGELSVNSDYTFGIIEFSKQKEVKKILKDRSEGFRVLKLRWEKDYEKNIRKIRRAVLERNVKIIILDMSRTTVENALEYVRQSKNRLKEIGFAVKKPAAIKNINPVLSKYSLFTKGMSFLIAIMSPIACLVFIQTSFAFSQKLYLIKTFVLFLIITIFSLMSGIVISGLLSTKNFMLGAELFRGTKIVLILPVILSFLLLYKNSLKDFIKKPVLFGGLFFWGVVAAALWFYLMRSGNSGIILSMEETLRLYLEKLFLVRPRLKEFLIGHPFMLLAIYLKHSRGVQLNASAMWKPFFIIGIIGQISVINTFCHIHSPVFVSLLRTFNGLCLGAILGILLIYVYKKMKPRITYIPPCSDKSEQGGTN